MPRSLAKLTWGVSSAALSRRHSWRRQVDQKVKLSLMTLSMGSRPSRSHSLLATWYAPAPSTMLDANTCSQTDGENCLLNITDLVSPPRSGIRSAIWVLTSLLSICARGSCICRCWCQPAQRRHDGTLAMRKSLIPSFCADCCIQNSRPACHSVQFDCMQHTLRGESHS